MGKEVYIISISVDPAIDTPASLKAYAKKLNAGPGWYFLTGNKESVDFALKKIGHFVDNKQSSPQHLHHRKRTHGFVEEGFWTGAE